MDAAIFFINSLQNGGAERVVVNQAEELARRGVKVFLILIHNKQYYTVNSDIENIILYKQRDGIKKVLSIPILTSKLDKEILQVEKKYNIVLMTAHLPYAHMICRFSRYAKRFIYVMHNPQFQFYNSNSFFFRKKISFMYNRQKIVAVSHGVENELLDDYNLKTNWICTIYNPINFNEIEKKRREKTDNDIIDEKYILFVGRLTTQKRVDRLLNAYKMSKLYKTHKLVILGVGELQKPLEDLCCKLDINNNVLFEGWESNVYKWMEQADLLVCSSDYESFGMVIAEAIYCGCRVVSTDCKFGPNEILRGDFSKYLSGLTPEELAKVMKHAIDTYPNQQIELVKEFNVTEIMDCYLSVYREWCEVGEKNG